MPAQVTTVTVQGVKVRLHRMGRGPSVLFLHGAGGMPQWLPFYDALADGYELLVPEHPGFAGSDDPAWIRNVPDLAMFYLDLIEAMGLERFHLIGHSLGGWVAAEMLVRDRARCQTMTLIAPAGLRVKGVPCGDLFIWNPEETQRNLYYDQSFADRVLSIQPTEEQMDVLLKNRFTTAKFGWQPRWFDPDLEKWLHRIKLPALVVWGEDDKVFPVAYAEPWQRHLPDGRVLKLAKCGHVPQVEQADTVTAHVRAFLKEAAR
jgi:pimeloyl-ACP methyl ester carboxylesterase